MTVCKDPPSVSLATAKMNGKPACTDVMDYVRQKVRSFFILGFVRFNYCTVNFTSGSRVNNFIQVGGLVALT
jgi:hypothetical protein